MFALFFRRSRKTFTGRRLRLGLSWVIKSLIRDNVKPIDLDEAFEESIRQCYPETVQVGWMELDTVQTMKDADSVSWDLAQGEWVSEEENEGQIATFDNGSVYYYVYDIERYLDEAEAKLVEESA